MKKTEVMFIAVFLGLLIAAVAVAAPDDHVITTSSRTYMGRTTPPQPYEMWISADKMSYLGGRVNFIYRYDLGVRWTIIPQLKKYLEEPLSPNPEETKSEEKFRIQEYGFREEPEYDWTVDVSKQAEIIDGKSCFKVTAVGEADFASEIREIWLTKDVPIDLGRYYEKIVKPEAGAAWRSLYEKYAVLRDGLTVKSITTTEFPIAPTMITESKLTRVEIAAAPPGIYDAPAGFQKVMTREELYAR